MIYLKYEDLAGNESNYVTVEIDWIEIESFLQDTHYHIIKEFSLPIITGISQYFSVNHSIELKYKEIDTSESLRGKSILFNNTEIAIYKNIIGILFSKIWSLEEIAKDQLNFIMSFVEEAIYRPISSDGIENEIALDINNEFDRDVLYKATLNYVQYLDFIINKLQHTEICSNYEVSINFASYIKENNEMDNINIKDRIPTSCVLYLYIGFDAESSTTHENMFVENEEDIIVNNKIRIKYFVPKDLYEISKDGGIISYREREWK